MGLNRRFLLVDIRKGSKPDLPCGLHIIGLLNEDGLGVLKQSNFHEKQSAIILETISTPRCDHLNRSKLGPISVLH